MYLVHQEVAEFTNTQCQHTHASQCAKNKPSLAIFSPLNQAEVTVIETRVVMIRTTASSSSPSKRPLPGSCDPHDDIDILATYKYHYLLMRDLAKRILCRSDESGLGFRCVG